MACNPHFGNCTNRLVLHPSRREIKKSKSKTSKILLNMRFCHGKQSSSIEKIVGNNTKNTFLLLVTPPSLVNKFGRIYIPAALSADNASGALPIDGSQCESCNSGLSLWSSLLITWLACLTKRVSTWRKRCGLCSVGYHDKMIWDRRSSKRITLGAGME